MAVVIRPYLPEDLPAVLAIINYHISHTTAIYDYEPRSIAQQQLLFEEKASKQFPVFVAVATEGVVGFGTYDNFRPKKGYQYTVEHSLYLMPAYQNKGIGGMLMTSLLGYAKAHGIHTMIGVIDSQNEGSIAFHERFGFIKVGHIAQSAYKFNMWLDSVFMQKLL